MKKRASNLRGLIVPLLLVGLALAGLAAGVKGVAGTSLSTEQIFHKICIPLARLIFFLALGLLVGQVLESTGWTRRLGLWVKPMTRWAHLREESGAAFVSSFVSGVVANTLLMNAYADERLSRRELTLTYLLNNGLPLYLVHMPTTFFVVSSLAGTPGIIYMGIGLAAALIRSAIVLPVMRVALPAAQPSQVRDAQAPVPETRPAAGIWARFRGRFVRLAMYTSPIYVLVFLANDWGLFSSLRRVATGWISGDLFPLEAAGVVIFALAAEFGSGMAAAGALMDAGALTVKQTVIALILGTIVATPIRAIRHQLPSHAGIFNLALGSELLLVSQLFRMVTLSLVTIIYAIWV